MSELTVTDKVVVPNEVFGNLTVINGEQGVFFIGKEVATMLGYTNTRKAVRDHCKKAVSVELGGGNETALLELDPQTKIIPESDVYRLIIKSKLPSAEAFEEWVMEEVLPQIRKTGGYSAQPVLPDFTNPAIAARAWADEVDAKMLAQAELIQLEQKAAKDAPKVELHDRFLDAKGVYSWKEASANLKLVRRDGKQLGSNLLTKFLRECGVFSGYGTTPFKKHIDAGRFEVNTSIVNDKMVSVTRVTPKGLSFIFKLWNDKAVEKFWAKEGDTLPTNPLGF